MTTESTTRLMTADEFLRLKTEGVRTELIRGVVHETPLGGFERGAAIARLNFRLYEFVEPRRLGSLAVATGIWLERDPDTVRGTALTFMSAERLPIDHRIEGYPEIVPDLVVEVRFHWEGGIEFYDKVRMWVSHGAPLVWAIDTDTRTIDIHRPGAPVATLGEVDDLDGLDVLPGFTCPVAYVLGT